METIPITEAKARIAELAERIAREHDHFTITRNGRADVMLISVAEYESTRRAAVPRRSGLLVRCGQVRPAAARPVWPGGARA
jgi:prevent-host-death family protein